MILSAAALAGLLVGGCDAAPADDEPDDWERFAVTLLDGSGIEIYGPPGLRDLGPTWSHAVDFAPGLIEFTAGDRGFGRVVSGWEDFDFGPPSPFAERSMLRFARRAALWQGQDYAVLATSQGSLPEFEKLVLETHFQEGPDGVVLALPPEARFDQTSLVMHQPLPDGSALQISSRSSPAHPDLSDQPHAVVGGALHGVDGPDGLSLVTDSLIAQLLPGRSRTGPGDVWLMSHLELSWDPPPQPASDSSSIIASGALPDGTRFGVTGRGPPEDVEGIYVAIVADVDGGAQAIGILTVHRRFELLDHQGGLMLMSDGDWDVRLAPYDQVLRRLGPDSRQVMTDLIDVKLVAGLPVFVLSSPLRLPTDDELPFQIGVQYETFEVRRGCVDHPEAVCAANGCAHVLPLSALYAPTDQTGLDPGISVTAQCPPAHGSPRPPD